MSAGTEPQEVGVAEPIDTTGSAAAHAGGATRQPLINISDLSIAYRSGGGDVRAVRHVDLALHAGEVVGLAGESGCGKSTLAYGSMRLLRPPAVITGGSVTYHGRRLGAGGVDVLTASPAQLRALRWREIAIVFQSAMNSLNPVLRVRDQLLDALAAHLALTREQRHDRVVELIELVGIPRARLAAYPHELSGGMRQRVMIAMALAAEPEVVIMDEPTTALDVVVQREILAEIFELKDALGFSVLFITHDLSLLLEIADRVVIMYAGQVVESGTREEIHRRAAHPYTRGLLTSFPSLRGPRVKLSGIPGSPPDLRGTLLGCPFVPRCGFATDGCTTIDMALTPVEPGHLSACPFVNASPATERTCRGGGATRGARRRRGARGRRPGEALPGRTPRRGRRGTWRLARTATRHDHRAGGRERLWQDDGGALAGRPGTPLGRPDPARRRPDRSRRPAGVSLLQGSGADGLPGPVRVAQPIAHGALPPRARPAPARGPHWTATPARTSSTGCSGRSAYPRQSSSATPTRTSFRAGSANAWRSRGRWPPRPAYCSPTSPVSMLDVSIRLEMLDLIEELRARLDLAVLYITHDIASARYFADEILVMHGGEIVERGPAEQVTQAPGHEYTRLLIASAPDPDAFGRQLRVRREDRAMT